MKEEKKKDVGKNERKKLELREREMTREEKFLEDLLTDPNPLE